MNLFSKFELKKIMNEGKSLGDYLRMKFSSRVEESRPSASNSRNFDDIENFSNSQPSPFYRSNSNNQLSQKLVSNKPVTFKASSQSTAVVSTISKYISKPVNPAIENILGNNLKGGGKEKAHKPPSRNNSRSLDEKPKKNRIKNDTIDEEGENSNSFFSQKGGSKGRSKTKKLEKNYDYADVHYWANTYFPWSDKLLPVIEHYYGYRSFRPNQKGVINATLSKRDVFVCMPTGYGKSLIFQLPAIISRGITLVIMPLLSLIYDQITQMEQKNITVLDLSSWGGQVTISEFRALIEVYRRNQVIMDNWDYKTKMPYPKILFTTPEKISKSNNLNSFLKALYEMNLLDRIVIDEAHCVSQWGHDFRKDYLNLSVLREHFPDVSILALTSTAPETVKIDVINNLNMKNVLYFQNSFNRPNLIFEVRHKEKDCIADIAKFIKEHYPKKSGIIYTTTTKESEKVAKELKTKYKMKCEPYHASLSDKKRHKIHSDWLNDEINIVVATIAFGMGINKLDVRFVIHHSLSKSIAHYYQEAGRAGRDGLKSHCLVFYKYSDKSMHDFLNGKNASTLKKKEEARFELMNVVKFCEDEFTCRRVMILSYFGEKFDRKDCNKTCDNCRKALVPVMKNMTDEAKKVVEFVLNRTKGYTLIQLTQILSGRLRDKKKKIMQDETVFGLLKHLKMEEIERLLKELLYQNVLVEKLKKMRGKFAMFFGKLHTTKTRAKKILEKDQEVIIPFSSGKKETEVPQGMLLKDFFTKQNSITLPPLPSAKQVEKKPERVYYKIKEEVPSNMLTHNLLASREDLKDFVSKKEDLSTDIKKKYVYGRECGYCTSNQFDEILERLKLVRKRLFLQIQETKNAIAPDSIIPIEGLYELCRKLPVNTQELMNSNIRSIGNRQLSEYGPNFLDEIQHFVKVNQINKTEFLIPKDVEIQENREVFDIQEHLAKEEDRAFQLPMEGDDDEIEELNNQKDEDEDDDMSEEEAAQYGMDPELDFDFNDYAEMNPEELSQLMKIDSRDSFREEAKESTKSTFEKKLSSLSLEKKPSLDKKFTWESKPSMEKKPSTEKKSTSGSAIKLTFPWMDDDDEDLGGKGPQRDDSLGGLGDLLRDPSKQGKENENGNKDEDSMGGLGDLFGDSFKRGRSTDNNLKISNDKLKQMKFL